MKHHLYYDLVGRTPVAVDSYTWGKAFHKRRQDGTDSWSVALNWVNECRVSTVFLGLDHNWGGTGDPVLFETLVFGGPLDGEMRRYRTFEEAERGHADVVAACQKEGE